MEHTVEEPSLKLSQILELKKLKEELSEEEYLDYISLTYPDLIIWYYEEFIFNEELGEI